MNAPANVRLAAAFLSVCITTALLASVVSIAHSRDGADSRPFAKASLASLSVRASQR